MSTSLVVTQPGSYMVGNMNTDWSSGICDCGEDLPQCCLAFWCLPCFTCKTSREAGQCLCLPLLDAYGLIPPIATSVRVAVRTRYGIEDTVCNDCVYACCCGPCSWCQIAREMKTRKTPIVIINTRTT